MADATDLTETVETLATSPAEVTVDGMTVIQQPLGDVLKAQQQLANQAALPAGRSAWGAAVRPARMVAPSSVGPRNSEAE